jgi:hypothetical protein
VAHWTVLKPTNFSTIGVIDICGYAVSIIALAYLGRKTTSCGFFALAGTSLLAVLAIEKGRTS